MFVVVILFVFLAWWRMGRLRKRATKDSAEPPTGEPPTPDAPEHHATTAARRKLAVATVSAAYLTFAVWTFFAWYRAHKPLSKYRWGGDGWMGVTTYAGGADKCGHAWATMALARLGTYILTAVGGYRRLPSSLLSAAMSEVLFTGVEVRDGFFYEFSFSD